MDIRRGISEDKEEIIDFIDYVFSKSSSSHDFATLHPRLYGTAADTTSSHYLVTENNRIRAVVCSLIGSVHTGGEDLSYAAIGSVAAHPRDKGKGYMKHLMNRAVEDMKNSGIALSILLGQRQRYEYFGYHLTGMYLKYDLDRSNIRHAFGTASSGRISTEKLTVDSPYLNQVYEIYSQQQCASRSLSDFIPASSAWNTTPWAILKDQTVVGYYLCSQAFIPELILKDWSDFSLICTDILYSMDHCTLLTAPWEAEKQAMLSKIAESSTLESAGMYQIFDYPKVIRALLRCKAAYTKLEQASVTLEIDGQAVTITVSEDQIQTEAGGTSPLAVFTSAEAASMLFSLSGALFPSPKAETLPRGWFPLPLYLHSADLV